LIWNASRKCERKNKADEEKEFEFSFPAKCVYAV